MKMPKDYVDPDQLAHDLQRVCLDFKRSWTFDVRPYVYGDASFLDDKWQITLRTREGASKHKVDFQESDVHEAIKRARLEAIPARKHVMALEKERLATGRKEREARRLAKERQAYVKATKMDTFLNDDQPTRCPVCQTRTEFISRHGRQLHWCLNDKCQIIFMAEDNKDNEQEED